MLWELITIAAKQASGTWQFQTDFNYARDFPTLTSFSSTILHMFGARGLNILRGLAGTHGGSKTFAFDLEHNLPFPAPDTVASWKPIPEVASGISSSQVISLHSLLKIEQISTKIVTPHSTVVLGTIAKDATVLKPSLRRHIDTIIGLTTPLTYDDIQHFQKTNTAPSKDDFITAVDEVWFTTLCNSISCGIGSFFVGNLVSRETLLTTIWEIVDDVEICAQCMKSELPCITECGVCLATGAVCVQCVAKGYQSWHPLQRPCGSCLAASTHCLHVKCLVLSQDSDPKNSSLMKLLLELAQLPPTLQTVDILPSIATQISDQLDSIPTPSIPLLPSVIPLATSSKSPLLAIDAIYPMPDAVHLLKSLRNTAMNWWLSIQGHRTNWCILLVLYLDKDSRISKAISKAIPAKAIRNRDHMAFETLLDITGPKAQAVTLTHQHATITIIPSLYFPQPNASNVLNDPFAITQHQQGSLFVADRADTTGDGRVKGGGTNLYLVHLHYPANIRKIGYFDATMQPRALHYAKPFLYVLTSGINNFFILYFLLLMK